MNEALLSNWRAILVLAAAQRPTCARDISRIAGVPIANTYRLLKSLCAAGLLQVAYVQHRHSGSGMRMYVCLASKVVISFLGNAPRTIVIPRTEVCIELAQETRT